MAYSSFHGIEIGKSGLMISQLGLDITGHNIANVDTKGYTRQRIISTAYDPFASIGRALPVTEALVGHGVRVLIHDQIRSAYLDRRFRTENTSNGYWQKRVESLSYLESYFDNVVEETSINYTLAKFFEAIKVLAEDTVEGAQRKLLQTAGKDMAQQLNTIYEGLIDLQSSMDLAVKTTVEEINRIAQDIVDLNKSIYGFEATGYIANDLRDKRNVLLDDLSKLVDIEYREESDSTGNMRLIVEIGGHKLLDHDKRYGLTVEQRANVIPGEADIWVPVWEAMAVPVTNAAGEYMTYYSDVDGIAPKSHDLTALLNAGGTVDTTNLAEVQNAVDRINQIARRFAAITPEWEDYDRYQTLSGLAAPTPAEEDELAALTRKLEEPLALIRELKKLVDDGVGTPEVELFAMRPNPWDFCIHTGISIGGNDFVYACVDEFNAGRELGYAQVFLDMEYPGPDLVVKSGELKAYLDMRDSLDPKTPGIPYYINMLNDLARALVQEVNRVHRYGWTDNPNGSETGVSFFDDSLATWAYIDKLGKMYFDDGLGGWEDETGTAYLPGVDPTLKFTFMEDDGTYGMDYWVDNLDNMYFEVSPGVWEDAPSGGTAYPPGTDPTATYEEFLYNLDLITAKNIKLSDMVDESEFNIACSSNFIEKHGIPTELQRGNNENMNLLYTLFLKKDLSIFYDVGGVKKTVDIGSFDGYATSIRFDVANTLSFAKKTADTANILMLAADNQRISVSGVSLDEEMTNLIKYQHAYNGAARVITAMDEILDRLINNTGRVGL